MGDALRIVHLGDEERLPMVVTVEAGDGAWTPGPCAQVECGNVIELTVAELEWLVQDAGPQALTRLRALDETEGASA